MRDRLELAQHFADLGFKEGAEIGVCDGRYSEILCRTIPGLKLYGVDPYLAYVGYMDYREQPIFDRAYLNAKEKLDKFPGFIWMKMMSEDAAKLIPDGSLDFVFIDANHKYDFVLGDIRAWEPKVRMGGIVSGHDYYNFRSGQVVKAVNDYAKESGVVLRVTEWQKYGTCHRDDRRPDWYFVKGDTNAQSA
jgi:hypothetical protein